MLKTLLCTFAGATVGGLLLVLLVGIGENARLEYLVYRNGESGLYANVYVNCQPVVTKLAVILGVNFGAVIGGHYRAGCKATGSSREEGTG